MAAEDTEDDEAPLLSDVLKKNELVVLATLVATVEVLSNVEVDAGEEVSTREEAVSDAVEATVVSVALTLPVSVAVTGQIVVEIAIVRVVTV